MHRLEKVFFGGYSRSSTEEVINGYKDSVSALNEELKQRDQVIEDLTQTILNYREREKAISDALVDAQEKATQVMTEAENKAEALYEAAEESVKERLIHFEKTMAQMNAVKEEMIAQQNAMKVNLLEVLTAQVEAVKEVDMSAFSQLADELVKNEQHTEQLVVKAKTGSDKVVVLPRSIQSSAEEDVPIFAFERGNASR